MYFGTSQLFAEQLQADTALVNTLIKLAKENLDFSPDSSVIYFQKAIEQCNTGIKESSKNKKNHIALIRKSIEAELGLGLIYYQQVDYKLAMNHFEKAFGLAKTINEHYYLGECLFNFAEVFLEQSKYSLAMTRYSEALMEYLASENNIGIYWSYLGMGVTQKQCGNFKDAIICYEKALAIAQKSDMKSEVAYCYNNIGNVYRKQGNLIKAMDSYEKAFTRFSEMNDELSGSDCLTNIGNLYLDKGDPFRALDYYNRAIHPAKVKADNYRMISRYQNLADAYSMLKDYQNSSLFLEKAINLAEKSDDKLQLASCYAQVGNLHIVNGLQDIGISYLKKSIELFHSVGSKSEEAESLVKLANAELKEGKINDAFQHAEEGERLATNTGTIKIIFSASSCLAALWERKGDTQKSLSYFKKAFKLKDSLFSVEKNRAIEEIEAGFTRTRLESENKLLAQTGKLQQQSLRIRNILVFSLSLCLFLSMLVIWLVYIRHIDSKSIAKREEVVRQKEIEKLNENLLFKERELTSKTLYITQKNNLLQKLIEELGELKDEPGNTRNKVDRLQHELKNELSPNSWKEFEVQFNDVHPGFQNQILEKFPDLSPTERRLCAFLRLDMNTCEIASLTGQSFKSLEVARTRIRKKLGLSREENLTNFIASI